MNYSEFYRTLDRLYEEQDQEKIEHFLRERIQTVEKPDESAAADEIDAKKRLAAAVFNEAASWYRGKGDWDRCLSLYERLISSLQELGITEGENYATALMNRGTAYRFMGKAAGAEEGIGGAGENFGKAEEGLGGARENFGKAKEGLGGAWENFRRAEEGLGGAWENFRRAEEGIGGTGENFGKAKEGLGGAWENFRRAEEDFRKAGEMLSACRDPNPYTMAGLYNNHAALAAEMGETDRALEMYEAALASLEPVPGTDEERAVTLAAMSLLYLSRGDMEQASGSADRALELIGDPQRHPHGGAIVSAAAHCSYRTGDMEKAADLFLMAAGITKKFFGENYEYQNHMENYRRCGR